MKYILSVLVFTLLSPICFALNPDTIYHITPDSLGLEFKEFKIETKDNALLNTWVLKATEELNNGNVIILAYGDAGNMSYWLNQAGVLNQSGYTVVLFDYRGFGESSAFKMNPDQLYYAEFAEDLTTIIQWTKEKLEYKKFGILSFSMGTIMTTLALQTEHVDFIIGEGYVLNPMDIKYKIYKFKQKKIKLPKNSKNYTKIISKIDTPMLLISGTLDNFTTLEDSQLIVKQNTNRKLIEFIGNHLEGFQVLSGDFYGQIYLEEIELFLKNI